MQQMTYNDARSFETSLLADDVEITGIKSPDYADDGRYDVEEADQWRQFFRDCRDSGGGPISIQVQVEDIKGGQSVGDQSDWMDPDQVAEFIAKHRGGGQ